MARPKLLIDAPKDVIVGYVTDHAGEVSGADFFVIVPSDDHPSDTWVKLLADAGVRILRQAEHIE